MAKKQQEEVVEKTTNEPKGDVTKVKAKMKKPAKVIEETITKVNLDKPPTLEKENTDGEKEVKQESPILEEVQQETPVLEEKQETPVLEEVTKTTKVEDVAGEVEEAIIEFYRNWKSITGKYSKVDEFYGGNRWRFIRLCNA